MVSKKWTARDTNFRPIIAGLVQALCAVPMEAREEWVDELISHGSGIDAASPDLLVIRQVLGNLDAAEIVADRRREEAGMRLPSRSQGIGTGANRIKAYRRIIVSLINAFCGVPRGARDAWQEELMEKREFMSPEEFTVLLALINIGCGEGSADRLKREARSRPKLVPGRRVPAGDGNAAPQREEAKPKLYPIVGRVVARLERSRSGPAAPTRKSSTRG